MTGFDLIRTAADQAERQWRALSPIERELVAVLVADLQCDVLVPETITEEHYEVARRVVMLRSAIG